ncbi:uncharacterized protein [Amphiura filiformis]|uniref:uncharacterized protein n=1 Tax=Amphiura filiformis TaxID=82378 RepID=UPI003B2243F7
MKACEKPSKYMSMILDGMDQHVTQLPKPLTNSKSMASMWKLPTHITGAIVHGRGQHVFVDINEVPHDSNMTMNVLLQVLLKYPSLPPVLYLQLDNCVRENKNRFMFAMCCMLVELQIFRKIKMSFLPVGHTHEDIDQFFSRIAQYLRKRNVQTIVKLLRLIKEAYKKLKTTTERLKNMFNIRDWLMPSIAPMRHHTQHHVFRFTLNEQGKAVMHTRQWANMTKEWTECDKTDNINYIIQSHPEGIPDLVPLCFIKPDLATFEVDIKKMEKFPWMKSDHLKEWGDFLQEIKHQKENPVAGVFPIHELVYGTNQSHDVSQDPSHVSDNQSEFEALQMSQPDPVQIGPKRVRREKMQLLPGNFVAVYTTKYKHHWPQIGEIVSVNESDITLNWYNATYTGYCSPAFLQNNGKKEKWVEDVNVEDTISDPFKLTKASKLPVRIVEVLKVQQERLNIDLQRSISV